MGNDHQLDSPGMEPKLCRNCGKPVPQQYCSWCGQSTKEIRVSFRSLLVDFVGEYFTIDSKLVRSGIPLLFRPGFLTCVFLEGKRVPYIQPLRLYLFSSVLFFLTLALVTGGNGARETLDSEATVTGSGNDASDENSLADLNTPEAGEIKEQGVSFTEARFDETTVFGRYVNERLDAQDRRIKRMGYDAYMRSLVRGFLSALPKALFLLMPLFALLLKVCYLRSDPLYIDHLIFAFHYHAFIYALTSILLIIGSQSDGLLALSLLCGILCYPGYLLLAMKRVYDQGWFWTLFKFGITMTYFIGVAVFLPFFFLFNAIFLN
ncbi:MAG: DUF3667 domain-containing protein [Aureliella sp.]